MKKRVSKAFLLGFIVLVLIGFNVFDLYRYLSLDYLKLRQLQFQDYYVSHQLWTLLSYFLLYVIITALSLPGAAVLTLAAGAMFGFSIGLILVSFASSLGASLAFLAARFVFRDLVEAKFGNRLKAIHDGIKRDGAFYLFTLRLVPIFPFFVINLLMGLTSMRVLPFYVMSQIGMLPGTMIFVNAGTQLAKIETMAGILSPGIVLSFVLLGMFPFLARSGAAALKRRRVLARWVRPPAFDYNVVVIGAGSGGLVSAYIAAAVKAKVALIEKHAMGGDCLNTGCVPSKALIKSAKVVRMAKRAQDFGFKSAHIEFDFSEVMERVQRVIKTIEPHDSVDRYQSLGVECIKGEARILSPFEVEVGERRLRTRNIIIATGAAPLVPNIEGIEAIKYYTSDSIWTLRIQPKRLLIIGAGPIGCELAQAFQRLGSKVTLVDMAPTILSREDADVSKLLAEVLQKEGVNLVMSAKAKRFQADKGNSSLIVEQATGEQSIEFDAVLLALGRVARVTGFGLEELGVRLAPRGTIEHDEFLRTNIPNIYCVGDVAGPFQFTHSAAHQAWYAAVNALFSPLKAFKADYRVIPRVTFTDPEVATVGLTETEAKAQGIPYELTHYGMDELDRAIAEDAIHGFVKVLTVPGKDTILGATVVGAHAGESFIEFVSAMKHGFGLNKILATIHPYPTFAESNKYAAGVWKKAHAPLRVLAWLEVFHKWRRK